jgi:hypothetical protein
VPTPAQLRLAARIHYALKALLGEGIDVAAMLSQPDQAREVLHVCEASGQAELVLLAREFVAATEAAQKARPPVLGPEVKVQTTVQAAALAASPAEATTVARHSTGFGATGFDSTGFGASTTGELPAPVDTPAPRKSWFAAPPWRVAKP